MEQQVRNPGVWSADESACHDVMIESKPVPFRSLVSHRIRRRSGPGSSTGTRLVSGVIGADIAGLEDAAGPGDELLDSKLGIPKKSLAPGLEGDATLVEPDGDLQRLATGLQLGDGPLQLGERIVKCQGIDRRISRCR